MSLTLSTVGGTQIAAARRVSLRFALLDKKEWLMPTDGYTPAEPPLRAPKSVDAIL